MFNFNRRRSRFRVRVRASIMCRRLSLLCVVCAAALTGPMGAAHSIECQSEKGAGYPWAWREIDGKRCWYKGKPGMDKKLLQWAEGAATPPATKSLAATKNSAARRSSPSFVTDRVEHERLLHSYWPALPPVDVFNDRFGATRAKRL